MTADRGRAYVPPVKPRPTIAVIPARYQATRFPGKPLAEILGVPLIVRVADRVRRAQRIDEVWVATDDARIAAVAERAGFRTVMTDASCSSGTDRVAQAVALRAGETPALVVNVQGDEPLIDPRDLDRLVDEAGRHPEGITTLARRFSPHDDPADPNLVKVACTRGGETLNFSREGLPYRDGATVAVHVGVYAFPPDRLAAFVAADPGPRERSERLEQLRAFELNIPIYAAMCEALSPSIGVDVPGDVARVEAALRASRSD